MFQTRRLPFSHLFHLDLAILRSAFHQMPDGLELPSQSGWTIFREIRQLLLKSRLQILASLSLRWPSRRIAMEMQLYRTSVRRMLSLEIITSTQIPFLMALL